MSKKKQHNHVFPALSDDEADRRRIQAIEQHGVFFQQAVTREFIKNANDLWLFTAQTVYSEHPALFGGQTSADLLVRGSIFMPLTRDAKFPLTLVGECKKRGPGDGGLVLIRPVQNRTTENHPIRLIRRIRVEKAGGKNAPYSVTVANTSIPMPSKKELPWLSERIPVCEDGVWLNMSNAEDGSWQADKDSFYRAANQLCCGFLGVMSHDANSSCDHAKWTRHNEGMTWDHYYLPLLVTNSPLKILSYDVDKADLATGSRGNQDGHLVDVDAALCVHPFARLPGNQGDLREEEFFPGSGEGSRYKESFLIIRSTALDLLLGEQSELALAIGYAINQHRILERD